MSDWVSNSIKHFSPQHPYHSVRVLASLNDMSIKLSLFYLGELEDEEAVRKWLMDEDTLKIDGKIEEVNKDLLAYMYENVDDLLVFFYDEENDTVIIDLHVG